MQRLYGSMKTLGSAVLLLMVFAMLYSWFMALLYWPGIGV
jgi:hypothetical protein